MTKDRSHSAKKMNDGGAKIANRHKQPADKRRVVYANTAQNKLPITDKATQRILRTINCCERVASPSSPSCQPDHKWAETKGRSVIRKKINPARKPEMTVRRAVGDVRITKRRGVRPTKASQFTLNGGKARPVRMPLVAAAIKDMAAE